MSKYARYIIASLLGLFLAFPCAAFDLTGFWTSSSGTVYLFAHKDRNVLATYALPDPAQVATGVKAGDIAFVGDVVGQVVSGQFHQRFPLDSRDRSRRTGTSPPARYSSSTTMRRSWRDRR